MSIINTLIETVADAKDKEPEELEVALENHVSMVAVRRLDEHDGDSWTLQFELPEHTVRIEGDGTVFVERRQKPKPA